MCESGKQCCEGGSCGTHVDQLKRLPWVLMIWVCVLSLGLGASITFQIIFHQGSVSATPNKSTEGPNNTRSQLNLYDCFGETVKGNEGTLVWVKKNTEQKQDRIKIEVDGDYFLFLRVTLETPRLNTSYTVTVRKITKENSTSNITEERISNTNNTTGFMGIGMRLIRNTLLSVICSPHAKVDFSNTYLGLMKFPG